MDSVVYLQEAYKDNVAHKCKHHAVKFNHKHKWFEYKQS